MRRNWQHSGKPTQPTKRKGGGKQGKPYKPAQSPTARRRDLLGLRERAAKPTPAPSED